MPTLSREWKREKHKIQMNVYTVLFGQGVRKQFFFIGKHKLHGATGSKRHSLQAVELSQWSQAAVQIVSNPPPQQWGPDLPFFGHAGHADPLDGWRCCSQKRVMSRPIQVWICDICHKQIHVRKQISIRCNRIEHWVHLRCAGIRQAQYTDTCHLHRESRLTPHTDITPPPTPVQAPYPLSTYTTHTTATKTQTHVQHSPCPQRIGKAQTQFSHPFTPLSTHTALSQTHTHVTHSTNTSHKHVTCTRQNA